MGQLILVRHTEVAQHWRGRCYGRSDAGLGRLGLEAALELAPILARTKPTGVVSSPLRRARFLAGLVAREAGLPLTIDARLAECNFGSWEGRTWDDIYRESGDAMMGMVAAPASFRPGGNGETTIEVRDRAMAVFNSLRDYSNVLVISHGGPIAAIRGTLRTLDVEQWPSLVPQTGEWVEIGD